MPPRTLDAFFPHAKRAKKSESTGSKGNTENNENKKEKQEHQTGKIMWKLHESLLIASFNQSAIKTNTIAETKKKIAAFDLDSTLVKTKKGGTFPTSGDDWKWLNNKILPKLQQLHKDNYQVIIFSNQGGIPAKDSSKRYVDFKSKIEQITKELDIPLLVYAATKVAKGNNDDYRKPNTGMFTHFTTSTKSINLEESFFVGDAAGRKSDFSNSDIKFAENIGLKFYTPEKFFP